MWRVIYLYHAPGLSITKRFEVSVGLPDRDVVERIVERFNNDHPGVEDAAYVWRGASKAAVWDEPLFAWAIADGYIPC